VAAGGGGGFGLGMNSFYKPFITVIFFFHARFSVTELSKVQILTKRHIW